MGLAFSGIVSQRQPCTGAWGFQRERVPEQAAVVTVKDRPRRGEDGLGQAGW